MIFTIVQMPVIKYRATLRFAISSIAAKNKTEALRIYKESNKEDMKDYCAPVVFNLEHAEIKFI